MSDPSPLWDIAIKIAVDTAEEAEARSIVDMLIGKMEVTPTGTPLFVQFEDGIWATEIHVEDPTFEQVKPNDPLSVLSCLTVNLGPVKWLSHTDMPFDPESARAGQKQWPPGYWAMAGRPETLVHPPVRAMALRARRRRET
jgi:hypothetical protein